jgi:hypothetical protein
MPVPQTLKNHTRWDPPFHFFILPMLLLNLILSIYVTIHDWPRYEHTHLWWIAMSVVFFMMAGTSRSQTLRAQDRIICAEERLRLYALLPPKSASTSVSYPSNSSSPYASPPTTSFPPSLAALLPRT